MTITAKYASTCATCGGKVHPGTQIEWTRGSRAVHHAACVGPAPTATEAVARDADLEGRVSDAAAIRASAGRTITLSREGRRTYIGGDTMAVRGLLRDGGCHWDADRKAWWIGSHAEAETLEARALVRFTAAGDICVPLYDFEGELVTVARRLLSPVDGRKIHIPRGGTQRGTMLGRVQQIGRGPTMIAEGIFDALTAAQLWPNRLVLGAGGAGQLPTVARFVAARVRRARGQLWLIPDVDDVGQARAADAIRAARGHGLAVGHDLHVVDISPHHDLNDAHRAGWTP